EAKMPADRALDAATAINVNEELLGLPGRVAEAVKQRTTELERLAAANNDVAKEAQKKQHDQHVKPPDAALDVGKLVMYAQPTVTEIKGTSVKLARAWSGPFKIIAKPSIVNRIIQDTRNDRKKLTVHVERLKAFVGELDAIPEGELEVKEIMQERHTKNGVQYRVRWAGYSRSYDTWERESDLANAADILHNFKQRPEAERRVGIDKEATRKRQGTKPAATITLLLQSR